MFNFALIALIIIFFYLALKQFEWAVLLLLFALPSYQIRFTVLGIPSTLLEAMIIIVFAVWFVKSSEIVSYIKDKRGIRAFLKDRSMRQPYPFGNELIALLIISFISAGVAGFGNEALGIWKAYFFEPALLYIVIMNTFQGKEKKLVWALAASAFVVSAVAIFQKLTGGLSVPAEFWSGITHRATSVYPYPNAVGLYLAPLAALFIGYVGKEVAGCIKTVSSKNGANDQCSMINDQLPKSFPASFNSSNSKIVLLSAITVLSILAIIFAKSKGALLGLAAASIACGLLANLKSRIITLAIIIIAFSGIMAYPPARSLALERIRLQDISGEIRKQQWRETWQMLTANPTHFIFGAGLSGYQKAVAPYHQEGIFFNKDKDPDFRRKIVIFDDRYRMKYWQPVEIYLYPHNIFLNFWSELGLAGMLLIAWILLKYFYVGLELYCKLINCKLFGNCKLIIENYEAVQTAKKGKYIVIALKSAMIVILVHGLVDVPYFKNDLSALFWVLVALLGLHAARIEKSGEIKKTSIS